MNVSQATIDALVANVTALANEVDSADAAIAGIVALYDAANTSADPQIAAVSQLVLATKGKLATGVATIPAAPAPPPPAVPPPVTPPTA